MSKEKKQINQKYIKIENSDKEGLKQIGIKIQNGKAKWAYYAIENDKGYHFFIEFS
jgi:hypothetical protein